MKRARLARYGLFQLVDYMMERGLVTLLLVAMLIAPQLYILRDLGGGDAAQDPTVTRRLLAELAIPLAFLPVLFAINGISSEDRRRGYFRFLFSKPVRVPAYYAQSFVVRFVAVLAIVSVALLALALTARVPFPAGFLAYVAVIYAFLGGVGFLLSALVHFDGLALVFVWVASAGLLGVHRAYPQRIPEELTFVLPPVDKLDAARDAFVGGGAALPAGHLWWMVGYGAACFALGLVALARRELAR